MGIVRKKEIIDESTLMFSRKQIIRLLIPLIIEQFLTISIGLFDTMMISPKGEAAVSGVSLVDTINTLMISLFAALATGGTVIAAQQLGNGKNKDASASAKQLLFTVMILSVVVGLLCFVFNHQFIDFVYKPKDGASEQDMTEILSNAYIYFYVSALSYPFIGLYNAQASLFRAMGNSRVTMLVALMVNGVNIIGNALFIHVFDMGTMGAGLATLISRALAALVLFVLFIKKKDMPISFGKLEMIKPDGKIIKKILSLGIPSGIENSIFHVGKVMVASLVSTFGGAAVAANAVSGSVLGFGDLAGSAIGLAMITVVGQCIGAGKLDQADYYIKKLMKNTYVLLFFVRIAIIIFAPQICKYMFSLKPESTEIAVKIMRWHSVNAIVFWPTAFALPNALRAAGDVKYTMVVSSIAMWVCRIGLSFVFAKYMGMGVFGVWVAMTCDWYLRTVMFVIRFVRGKWKLRGSLA